MEVDAYVALIFFLVGLVFFNLLVHGAKNNSFINGFYMSKFSKLSPKLTYHMKFLHFDTFNYFKMHLITKKIYLRRLSPINKLLLYN